MSRRTQCENERNQIKHHKQLYEKFGANNEQIKNQFIQFFTNKFLDVTNDQEKRTKINNLSQGIIPANVNVLIDEMMDQVWRDMTTRCGKYMEHPKKHNKLKARRYHKLLQQVVNGLSRAIYGLDPIQTAKKIDTFLVPNELSPQTTLTPERFQRFVDELATTDKDHLPKDIRFTAQDVYKLMKTYNHLLASILQCDHTELLKLTNKVIRHALDGSKESKRQLVKEYGDQIRQLCAKPISQLATTIADTNKNNTNVKDKYPANEENLKKLLLFINHIFPYPTTKVNIDSVVKDAMQSTHDLKTIYEQYRSLLAILVIENDVTFDAIIKQIVYTWNIIKSHPSLENLKNSKLPQINDLSQKAVRYYLGEVIELLKLAKINLLTFAETKCINSNEFKRLAVYKTLGISGNSKDCGSVRNVAKYLDSMLEHLNHYVVNMNYGDFKLRLQELCCGRVEASIEDLLQKNEYSSLRSALNSNTTYRSHRVSRKNRKR